MLLKAETSLMENGVDALQSLNRAVSRVKVTWELKEVSASGEIALSVDDVVILKSIFPGGKTPTVKQYAAAATLAAISSVSYSFYLLVLMYSFRWFFFHLSLLSAYFSFSLRATVFSLLQSKYTAQYSLLIEGCRKADDISLIKSQ